MHGTKAPAAAAVSHKDMANAIRALAMDAVQQANSGHPGMPMGAADMATVLFTRFLKYDPAHPAWPDRDRFVLSAGHGSMMLYALGFLTGYKAMSLAEIKRFRQLRSRTPGHPEIDVDCGIETTTGPLGQGLANAVGMAIAERHLNARFGDGLVDHRTYVIAGDGDLMEGISHEAAALAGHLRLARLVVLYDDNHISIDGATDLSYSDDALKRFQAYGWAAERVDGHDPDAIAAALARAQASDRPSLIACRTTIGFGAPTKAGKSSSHGSPLGAEEIAGARQALGWPHAPFVIPDDILAAWRAAGGRGGDAQAAWSNRLEESDDAQRLAFERAIAATMSPEHVAVIDDVKRAFALEAPSLASRQSSGKVLDALVPVIPELVGGSADLTGSNNTLVKSMGIMSASNWGGRYIHYGVREHGMAAAMNGMALHGGVIPYGGSFLSFTDYCRPSIRLAALMRQRMILVMTHDSIGLGEDGPTHQPVEHLAALRAIPNLLVLRPGDAVETAECWQIALENRDGPSVLALTRQSLPTLRTHHQEENLCALGAYRLAESGEEPRVILIATGSELAIAKGVYDLLAEDGVPVRLVSMPCWKIFEEQDPLYRQRLLGGPALKVAIEAGIRQGWDRYVGPDGMFCGVERFGESAPFEEIYEHFGLTAESIAGRVRDRLEENS